MPETTRPRVRPRNGDELELDVSGIAFGGNGIARLDGYVVFVRDAIPGDRVRAVVTRSKRDYAEARAVELLAPGPDRIEPVAHHPGAPWQVLPYARQLEIKQEQVEDALRRIGRLDGFELEPIVPAVAHWRYRNKLEYSFGTGPDGGLVCGFHAPGNWEQIDPLDDCMLASERGNLVREQVLAWCRAQGHPAWDRRHGTGMLRNLVVREGRRSGQITARLVTTSQTPRPDGELLAAAVPAADGLLWSRVDTVGETTYTSDTEVLHGRETIEEELCGLRFEISPLAFFQTNTEMAEQLYGIAREYADLKGFERVYDLFSGIGTIGLTLAPMAAEVWGLEIVEEAVADAIRNARLNELDNVRPFAGDVRLALRELIPKAGRPHVVVVDPPRAGLSQKIVRRIIEAQPERIVYVSCNPTTLAPNAAQLVEAGYALRRVRAVDMFPQTPHIECVAEIVRVAQ